MVPSLQGAWNDASRVVHLVKGGAKTHVLFRGVRLPCAPPGRCSHNPTDALSSAWVPKLPWPRQCSAGLCFQPLPWDLGRHPLHVDTLDDRPISTGPSSSFPLL